MKIFPIILSGGSGTRLWPVSRENFPKPFIKTNDNFNLLQKTLNRVLSLDDVEEITTVTNKDYLFLTKSSYEYLSKTKTVFHNYILEPLGKNTCPAITAAAIEVLAKHGENAIMLVLPSDHVITNQLEFEGSVRSACSYAIKNKLVIFGVKPTSVQVGYGYIEAEGEDVIRFIEKPNYSKAQEFILSDNFFWNSGMFCFKASVFLEELCKFNFGIYKGISNAIDNGFRKNMNTELFLDKKFFDLIENISIDCAVLEKSDKIKMIKTNMGWSDVGTWDSFMDQVNPSLEGNRAIGTTDILFEKSSNCSVYSEKRFVGLLGVEDIIVIETADAVLIVNKKNSNDIKLFVNKLKSLTDLEATNQKVDRPWGSYTVLHRGSNFKVKSIVVNKRQKLSLQKHKYRAEHWVVVKGIAEVLNNDRTVFLLENESTFIPCGNLHRLSNSSDNDLEIIEIQSGSYLGEDDIERFKDDYDRII
jgi:mannose-1-phosphate guanylyltransferase/mannose-6-phosphate isomerase